LVVSAASSLAGAFEELARSFESTSPGIEVQLNVAGSTRLAEQIVEGAPVDVFASANIAAIDRVVDSGDAATQVVVFAHNTMAIGVPPGNPANVASLTDFDRHALILGACASAVPCGSYSDAAFSKAGVTPVLDTREPDAGALVLKLGLGEVDAGVIYVSDVVGAAGAIDGIDIPPSENVRATYPIAVIGDSGTHPLADAFVAFVLSDDGRAVLASYGFDLP